MIDREPELMLARGRRRFMHQRLMKGVDLTTGKELMGHKSIEMTLRYAHLAPEHKLDAVERLDTYMDTKATKVISKTSEPIDFLVGRTGFEPVTSAV